MGNNAAGVQQKLWVKAETTYNTALALVATDALDFMECKIEPAVEFEDRKSHVCTSSLQDELRGAEGGAWSIKCYLDTGAVGVAPDYGPILKAAFGTETVVGSTSVTYVLSDSQVIESLVLYRLAGDGLGEWARGCSVAQVKITQDGTATPTIEFSGTFASYAFVYGGAVTGAEATSSTTIEVDGTDRRSRAGAYIEFTGDDNSGAGYLVTADDGAGTITISPGIAGGGLSGGEAVLPLSLSQTITGSPVSATSSDLSIAATSMAFQKAEVTYDTGITERSGEASSATPTGLFRGMRKITGATSLFFDDDESGVVLANAWDETLQAINVRFGAATAAARVTAACPSARVTIKAHDIPDAEAVTSSVDYTARQSSTAADEFTLAFD